MMFSAQIRNTVWRQYCGFANAAYDLFDNHMTIHNFKVDHIWPVSAGGSDNIVNLMPLSASTNQAKGDNLSGIINGKSFQVIHQGQGIGKLYINNILVSK